MTKQNYSFVGFSEIHSGATTMFSLWKQGLAVSQITYHHATVNKLSNLTSYLLLKLSLVMLKTKLIIKVTTTIELLPVKSHNDHRVITCKKNL